MTTTAESRPAPGDSTVVVDVPARARSLRLLRLAVADAAADQDMDLDSIEAARIAVDELATVVLETASWSRLVIRVGSDGSTLRVDGHGADATGPVSAPTLDRVVQELLSVCVDDHGVGDDSSFWFTLANRNGEGSDQR